MIFAFIFAMYGLAALCGLMEEVTVAFAPVINSGSAVVAVAFVTAVYTCRRLRARRDGSEAN